jgi:hypothetical protein
MRLRDLTKTRTINYGHRTLMESILFPEVAAALEQLRENGWPPAGVLIGGIALSFHVKPRMTQDIDLLFLTPDAIPVAMEGFRRYRSNAFEHMQTGVEVEVVSPATINVDAKLVRAVFETAIVTDGIRVASASGLVALKLHRLHAIDEADIIQLIQTGVVDLGPFSLTDGQLTAYARLQERAAREQSGT